ncbi:MAG: hypothetical protein ACRDJE_19365, partial [Dehalococcoidia bacterium]
MTEEIQTRACQSCGWPALATTRRCPFCREPFPRPSIIRSRPQTDLLRLLALLWVVAMIPSAIVASSIVGAQLAILAFVVALIPAFCVGFLRQRSAMRIARLGGRKAKARGILIHWINDNPT